MSEHYTMKELPLSERPYEKYVKYGPTALSDAELLAIIIGSGTKSGNSVDIAKKLLSGRHANLLNLYDLSLEELMDYDGIGTVKAIKIKAVSELSKRIATTRSGFSMKLDSPSSIAEYYMETLRHEKTESFLCAYFDTRCHFLGDLVVAQGGANCAYVDVKKIFQCGLEKHAQSLIAIHNHPSGDVTPSEDDIRTTRLLAEKAKFMDFCLQDHIIIGDRDYFSFLEHGILKEE